MTKTILRIRNTALLSTCAVVVLATPSQAQPTSTPGEKIWVTGAKLPQAQSASCPPCSFYESEIAAAKASLSQLEQQLADDEHWRDEVRRTIGGLLNATLDEKPKSATDEAWEYRRSLYQEQVDKFDEIARIVQKRIDGLTQATEALKKTIQNLETAYQACRQDYCRPTKQIGMAASKSPLWAKFQTSGQYLVEETCPPCDAGRARLRDLLAKQKELQRAVDDAGGRYFKAVKAHEEATTALFSSRNTNPSELPEDTQADIRNMNALLGAVKLAKEEVEAAEKALEKALSGLEENQMEIEATEATTRECQQQSCAPGPKTTPAYTWPLSGGWYLGVSGGAIRFNHPKAVVDETSASISPPPGSDVSTTTDTSGGGGSVEVGYRGVLHSAPAATLFFDFGITGLTVPDFSGTYRIDTVNSSGTPIAAEIHYDFLTGRMIAPHAGLRVRASRGYFFDFGTIYYDVPMKLRTTERFFVDGSLVDSSVMEEKIHDSAFGYVAGVGWMGRRWEVGVSGRRARINNADLDILTVNVLRHF